MVQKVSVLIFCVIDAQLLLCIALRRESRRGADFPQYRQIGQRARKCVTANRTSEVPAEQPI